MVIPRDDYRESYDLLVHGALPVLLVRVYILLAFGALLSALAAHSVASAWDRLGDGMTLAVLLTAHVVSAILGTWFRFRYSRSSAIVVWALYAVLTGVTAASIGAACAFGAVPYVFLVLAQLLFGLAGWVMCVLRAPYRSSDLLVMVAIGFLAVLSVGYVWSASSFEMVIAGASVMGVAVLLSHEIADITHDAAVLLAHKRRWETVALVCALTLAMDGVTIIRTLFGFRSRTNREVS